MYTSPMLVVILYVFFSEIKVISNQIKTCGYNDVISKGVVYEGTTISLTKSYQNVNSHTINSCRRSCRLRCYCSAVVFKKPSTPGPNGCYFFNFKNISSHLEQDSTATLTYYDIPHKRDCKEINDADNCNSTGSIVSGVYSLDFGNHLGSYRARCDMKTTRGGWTLLQRRLDGSVNFYRDWSAYKNGFGDLNGEFWLGLDPAHELMKDGNNTMRFDLWDRNDYRFAEYSYATIASEADYYRLKIQGYKGDAGDSMEIHNGMKFTTQGVDHDLEDRYNCAEQYHGGWWYNECHHANLNGKYGNMSHGIGINWLAWKGHEHSLTKTEIKVKRNE